MFWFLCFRDGGYVPCARGERKHLQCHPRLSGHCQRNKLLLQIANFTSWQRKSVCIPHLFYCLDWLVNFHFDVICGLSLNRRTPKWILFVKRAFLSLWMLQLSYFSIMGKSWNNYRGKQIRGTFVTIKKPNPKEICVTFVTSLEWRCCLPRGFCYVRALPWSMGTRKHKEFATKRLNSLNFPYDKTCFFSEKIALWVRQVSC